MFGLVSKKSLETEEENSEYWKNQYNRKAEEKVNLELENQHLKTENSNLQRKLKELEFFVPKIKSGEIKKAVSKECESCEYCVKSSIDNSIYGCKKDCVCNDYKEQPKPIVNNINHIIPYYPYPQHLKWNF